MAKYSYNELKLAATEGRRIGGYLGKNVFACSKWNYAAKQHKDAFYVLYDDGNTLVYDGTIYGAISEKGLVDEWNNKRTWISPQSQVEVNFAPVAPGKSKISQKSIPATGYSAFVAGVNDSSGVVNTEDFFVRLDKEINELLATPFDAGDMSWVNEV